MKIVFVSLLAVLAIGAGVGMRYIVEGSGSTPAQPLVTRTPVSEVQPARTNAAVSPERKTITTGVSDCGVSVIQGASISISSKNGVSSSVSAYSDGSTQARQCFEQKFAVCSPASVLLQLPILGAEFRYEIMSKVEGGCLLNAVYTKNPDGKLVGPKATCIFNNKNSFFDVESNKFFEVCTGPLIDIFNNP